MNAGYAKGQQGEKWASRILIAKKSGEDILDDVSMDIGQATFEPVVVVGEALVIETHEVEDGGVEIIDTRGIFFGFGSEAI